jgi:type VI secretion system protein ImpJ
MTARAVHWHEGMFIRPHHFQAAQRHVSHLLHTASSWDCHYSWGLRKIDIDRDALANHRLEVRRLRVRLRDGTLVSLPEDGELPPLDLQTAFGEEGTLTVYLGVPVLHLGRPNVSGRSGEGRFVLDSLDLEDENTGLHPQPVQVRRLNLQVLLSTQDHAGYEVIPLVKLEKSSGADPSPVVHKPYIPPVVACDAWEPLQGEILQSVYDRIGRKADRLADQVISRGITLESHAQGDALIIAQLRTLNEANALFNILAYADGVHPLTAYYELCRLVGQLAFLDRTTRRPPTLPRYDHDDLGGCFWAVKKHLDFLLDLIVEPDYKQRPFVGEGLRMQVALEQAWIDPHWQMYVGVKSPLPPEDSVRLLVKGGLDMKIGSSENVDRIFQKGAGGLRFQHAPAPPRVLPAAQGLLYLQVSRAEEEWKNVVRTLTLAIRLNETRVAGNIQGQRTLTVKTGPGQTTTMEFTLYVVKAEAK